MAAFQTSTPDFEQLFNFEKDPQPEVLSFGDSPAVQPQDPPSSPLENVFRWQAYPFSGLPWQQSSPLFELSYLDKALNQVSFEWPPDTFIQSKHDPIPLHEWEALINPATSNVQHGQVTLKSLDLMSSCVAGKEDPSPPRQAQKSGSENQRNVTWSNNVDTKGRGRGRRSWKRKGIDPNDPVETEKRSKFLERNRVAVSKCRQKKREWATDLHIKARELQFNSECLSTVAKSLKEEVLSLKSELLEHSSCGISPIEAYIQNQIKDTSGRVCMCSQYQKKTIKDKDESSRRSRCELRLENDVD